MQKCQTHKCSNAKCTNAQMYKCQMQTCSNANCTNAQMPTEHKLPFFFFRVSVFLLSLFLLSQNEPQAAKVEESKSRSSSATNGANSTTPNRHLHLSPAQRELADATAACERLDQQAEAAKLENVRLKEKLSVVMEERSQRRRGTWTELCTLFGSAALYYLCILVEHLSILFEHLSNCALEHLCIWAYAHLRTCAFHLSTCQSHGIPWLVVWWSQHQQESVRCISSWFFRPEYVWTKL